MVPCTDHYSFKNMPFISGFIVSRTEINALILNEVIHVNKPNVSKYMYVFTRNFAKGKLMSKYSVCQSRVSQMI